MSENKLLADVKRFTEESKKKNSLVDNLCQIFPNIRSDLEKQLETFPADIEKMTKGKMDYAEMRAKYG